MQALIVIDAQNEFSPAGHRPATDHATALAAIHRLARAARAAGRPIAWVQHHNRPDESPAFVPGTWGARLADGLGPEPGHGPEALFVKDVFGAFSSTGLERWLRDLGVTEVLLAGFFTHMCVSTSAREALVRGFGVSVDPGATRAWDLEDPVLGRQAGEEVHRSALLHLVNMGVTLAPAEAGTASSAVPASFTAAV